MRLEKVVCHLSGSPLLGKTALAREVDSSRGEEVVLLNYGDVVMLQFDDASLSFAYGWWPFPRSVITRYPMTSLLSRPVGYAVEYSYAGFEYRLTKTAAGCYRLGWHVAPLLGQPPEAWKEEHLRNALNSYFSDYSEE